MTVLVITEKHFLKQNGTWRWKSSSGYSYGKSLLRKRRSGKRSVCVRLLKKHGKGDAKLGGRTQL
jgi:intein-encoded DNA endonuclease-like protein